PRQSHPPLRRAHDGYRRHRSPHRPNYATRRRISRRGPHRPPPLRQSRHRLNTRQVSKIESRKTMSTETNTAPPVDLSKPPAEGVVRVTFLPEGRTVEFPFDSL